ncbi:MAG TPA: hypothetical protein VKA50_10035 [Gammaproteobacteria bacterium]|nr:hypothetical protein [Gammaproteobacteria bacterium]
MSTTFEHRLLIGSRGWQHAGWQDSFYPDDLPPEWRLTYYANEFRVVLVPGERLVDETLSAEGNPARWCEDSDAGFRFVCETPPGLNTPADADAFLERIAPFGERCVGIRYVPGAEVLNRRDELDVLLERLASHRAVSVDLAEPPAEGVEAILTAHRCGRCWHGPPASAEFGHGGLALTVIPSPMADLRALRAVVETCLAASTRERISVLVFDGSPPSVETIEQAGTIADLL